VFGVGALGFGLLTSCLAVGGLTGALLAASTSGMPRPRWVLGAAAALGTSLLIASVMPVLIGFGAALVLCGGMFMSFAVLANTSVQLTAEPALRGRVVAVYLTFFLGGGALGAPVLGLVAERLGPMRAISLAGALGLLAAAGAAVLIAVRRHATVTFRSLPPAVAVVGPCIPEGGRNSARQIHASVYQRDTEAVDQ
jgi:hypothetical protein